MEKQLSKQYAKMYYESNRILDVEDHFMNGFLAGMKSTRSVLYKIRHEGKLTDFNYLGVFHGWGLSMEDTGEQVASYTQAIIETEGGNIVMVHPEWIKFAD